MKSDRERLRNIKKEDLLSLVNSKDTSSELLAKALIEFNRRENRNTFFRGTLVAWIAVFISVSALGVSITSLVSRKSNLDNIDTQESPSQIKILMFIAM